MNNWKYDVKRRKRNKKRTLDMLAPKALLKKKRMIEKGLRTGLRSLSDFVRNTKGDFLASDNPEGYQRLDGDYMKYANQIEELNANLLKEDRIDPSKYQRRYERLVKIVEERNRNYIEEECAKINAGKTEDELKERAGISKDPYVVPTIVG